MSAATKYNNEISHAGDVTPAEAWQELKQNEEAILIDVRTQPEWVFSGLPNLDSISKNIQTISWKIYPSMEVNALFVDMVKKAVPNSNAPIYFICKTGGRSLDAAIALSEAGYGNCFNVIGGFEGDKNDKGQRGCVNGWKAADLPWGQA